MNTIGLKVLKIYSVRFKIIIKIKKIKNAIKIVLYG